MTTAHSPKLHPQAAPDLDFIQRTDSEVTDDSPFSSSLTTPVDEDVVLFGGIEERLGGKGGVGFLKTSASAATVRVDDSVPASLAFSKAVQGPTDASVGFFDDPKASVSPPALPTRDEGNVLQNSDLSAPTSNLRLRPSIYALPDKTLGGDDTPRRPALNRTPTDADENVLLEARLRLELESYNPKLGLDKNAAAEHDFSMLPFANDDDDDVNIALLDQLSPDKIEADELPMEFPSLAGEELLLALIRLVLFLPWCAAVGGTILLSPSHLDLVAFQAGYVHPPPHGVRRFAHWADTALQHVGIFLGALALVGWCHLQLGLLLAGGAAAQFVHAWSDFVPDLEVPLGADDRQAVYLVARQFVEAGVMVLRSKGDGYCVEGFGGVFDEEEEEDGEL